MLPKSTRKLLHGTPCYCGTCGAKGTWDDMLHAMDKGSATFHDACWYDNFDECLLCHECWLK